MNAPEAGLHYDRRSIVLHWTTAALVAVLWSLGQTIDWFPKGDARVAARSVHILCGVGLAVVLIARIRWRLGPGRHLPPAGWGWLDRLATLTHWLLYALLVLAVVLGLANAWVRGDAIFSLFRIPALLPSGDPMRETVQSAHALAANALLVLALFHASAGLLHHFYRRDATLARMIPWLGR